MKILAGLLVIPLILCGCSGESREWKRGTQLQENLLESSGCTFQAVITADYGDKVHQFTLECQGNPEGDISFQVTEPQSISGIQGKVNGEEGQIRFEDTALAFDLLADDQLSPVGAPWVFWKTLRSGYLTSAGMEGEFLRLTVDDSFAEDAMTLDIWVNEQNLPVRAEILYESRRILSLEVRSFAIL